MPVENAIDLSRGLSDTLAQPHYGSSYDEVKAAFDEWQNFVVSLQSRINAAQTRAGKGEQASWQIHNRWLKSDSLSDNLSARRAESMIRILKDEIGSHTPAYAGYRAAEKEVEAAMNGIGEKFQADFQSVIEASSQRSEQCYALANTDEIDACSRKAEAEMNARLCKAQNDAIGREVPVLNEYQHQLQKYYGKTYHTATAIAANFSDPTYHDYASALVDSWRFDFYTKPLPTILMAGFSADYCKAANIDFNPAARQIGEKQPQICKDLGSKRTIVGSTEVVDVGFNCEKVNVKVHTPGPLGVFAQVEYKQADPYRTLDPKERYIQRSQGGNTSDRVPNLHQWGASFDGQLTVSVGESAGAAGNSYSQSASVTIDGTGNVVDASTSINTSTSRGLSVGGNGLGVETDTGMSGWLSSPSLMPNIE